MTLLIEKPLFIRHAPAPGNAFVLILLGCAALGLAISVGTVPPPAQATPSSESREVAQAMKETWHIVTGVWPKGDWNGLRRDIAGPFSHLYPELAARELRKSSAFAEAQAESLAEMLNPGLREAHIANDPQLRQQRNAAIEGILHPIPVEVDSPPRPLPEL